MSPLQSTLSGLLKDHHGGRLHHHDTLASGSGSYTTSLDFFQKHTNDATYPAPGGRPRRLRKEDVMKVRAILMSIGLGILGVAAWAEAAYAGGGIWGG